ncbi:nitroreductase family protein [Pseudodesulfovibrio sp.]|uniref:nitroreductase family protein n=1 Tax=Pseudodesulfovibrio sp. TaxID=2035812 RepID=UPI002635E43B|nr:nitroreductase family protein [Pseudodesulfovibrio sp.]MDD3312624.1 nitroreductase family protein [Pseudodesulfovibrio sp.]
MLQFKVDTEKCIRCGECARDCFAGVIGEDGDGLPMVVPEREGLCIECQHCLAVCPAGALSVFGLDPEAGRPLKGGMPDPGRMETLLMGRRSVRRYKKEGVDPALIRHLLEVASHAPTAVNRRPVRLTVVDDPAAMDRLRRAATDAALKRLRDGTIPAGYERIGDYLKNGRKDEDVIFRGAPHVLLATAPETALSPMADGHIVMSYFDLLASSHGLGTVWDGIARAVISAVCPELRDLLGIPADHVIVCVMAFGKPAVTYHRTVQRPGCDIHSATI